MTTKKPVTEKALFERVKRAIRKGGPEWDFHRSSDREISNKLGRYHSTEGNTVRDGWDDLAALAVELKVMDPATEQLAE